MDNMPYLFMTLTYPDETRLEQRWVEMTKAEKMDKEKYLDIGFLKITQHRWVFWKRLESYLNKQIPGVWRVEWIARKSGVFQGLPMPHIHILLMQQGYIPWQEVRWAWQSTIGERFVNVDVRAVHDPELTIHYLAKYLGKEEVYTVQYDAYLDSLPFGRNWGYMRKQLVKTEDKWTGRYFETDDIASLRHYAIPGGVELVDAGMCSFTLIGTRAREIGEILVSTDIDGKINMD